GRSRAGVRVRRVGVRLGAGEPGRTRRWWPVMDVVLRLALLVAAFLVLPLVVGQMEHKAMAHMQSRLGPMYAGAFHGWAQLVADGVKFAQKETIVPARADRRGLELAPAVPLLPQLFVPIVIPVRPQPSRHGPAGGRCL